MIFFLFLQNSKFLSTFFSYQHFGPRLRCFVFFVPEYLSIEGTARCDIILYSTTTATQGTVLLLAIYVELAFLLHFLKVTDIKMIPGSCL